MSLPDFLGGDSLPGRMLGLDPPDRGRSPGPQGSIPLPNTSGAARNSFSSSRPPTSAEIDAVIAAAMANAPPAPTAPPSELGAELVMTRSVTPLMTNLLPSAVGMDGRVNLFVGNLPYRVRWQDLKDLFRKAGTVLRADVSLGPDNRSRGYGTVLMGSREDAARAIDRFNGYTWQTRTLEVRPDRLPPEYEPQPHQNHHIAPPRPPLYTYHNMSGGGHSAYTLPGHLLPSNGPAWLPGQISPQRPPMNHPPGLNATSHHMSGHLSMQGMNLSPHSSAMSLSGTSPMPSGQSPNSAYGSAGMPLPLSGQNTGSHAHQPLGASPLAGSLTAGTVPGPSNGLHNTSRRESITHFAHVVSPDVQAPYIVPSSSNAAAPTSRPSSSAGRPAAGSPDHGISELDNLHQSRAAPPAHLGPLPPSLFTGVRSLISPTGSGHGPVSSTENSEHIGASPLLPLIPPQGGPTPLSIAMEGLAHQGPGLGPPSTLHDRVVFVSSLPLTMMWQELKDLLRPAGIIIRADVATDPDGRPRGFGTALFATEADAAKAVVMFNDRDLGGRRIRVHLERDSHHDPQVRRPSDQQVLGFAGPPPRSQDGYWHHEQSNGVAAFHSQSPPPSDPSSPIPPRLPWALNMSLNGTQTKPARGPPEVIGLDGTPHLNFRQMRHPGPISMPPFPVLDNGNPLSPLQTRNLPPMTPSMPDFVFNAYPETPPIHAHFLSPGLGPFSPGIPVTSSPEFVYNPFLNPAPGAPVNRYPQGGSAALGTPTTQSFPNNPIHGYSATSGHQNITQALAEAEYFPAQLPRSVPDPPSPLPLASSRLNPPTSPVNAKDRLSSNGAEEGASDQTRMTASMSLNDTRRPTPPSPTARSVQPQRIVSGLNLVDLARGEMQAGRASLDGRRPMLDVGWTGERRASFGDIGSRESK